MNFARAIQFGLYLYISTFITFGVVALVPGLPIGSFGSYVLQWILTALILLLLAKWYFRKDEPTARKGFFLGLTSIGVGIAIDVLFILGILLFGGSLETFGQMYTDWKFYVSIALVILLCTYAGYEFDSTYIQSQDVKHKNPSDN